jgi:hypothetical protein
VHLSTEKTEASTLTDNTIVAISTAKKSSKPVTLSSKPCNTMTLQYPALRCPVTVHASPEAGNIRIESGTGNPVLEELEPEQPIARMNVVEPEQISTH